MRNFFYLVKPIWCSCRKKKNELLGALRSGLCFQYGGITDVSCWFHDIVSLAFAERPACVNEDGSVVISDVFCLRVC